MIQYSFVCTLHMTILYIIITFIILNYTHIMILNCYQYFFLYIYIIYNVKRYKNNKNQTTSNNCIYSIIQVLQYSESTNWISKLEIVYKCNIFDHASNC